MSVITVKEFSGYSEFDNNNIYDLVVSLEVLQTSTNLRTPIDRVVVEVKHMLEHALVLQGLTLLGHPGAAAFEVKVNSAAGLIEVTREQMREQVDEKLAEVLQSNSILVQELADARSRIMSLSSANSDLMDVCDDLRHRIETN